jgi:hypothetical protein
LLEKVRKTILRTGYPLELEIGVTARRKGWITFHSVAYESHDGAGLRELDLLAFKQIHQRRIELRVSCKSSVNKQFVFFTRDMSGYLRAGDVKVTPVVDDRESARRLFAALAPLPFYSGPREVVNYTVLAGDNVDRDARVLLRDALMSTLSSLHYRILPNGLLDDERGTAYFFVVVLRGAMYEASYDESANDMRVEECKYARWTGRIAVPKSYTALMIPDAEGNDVPFFQAMHYFGDFVSVEFVKDTYFSEYLDKVDAAFVGLSPDAVSVLGKPWISENFPKTVIRMPRIGQALGGQERRRATG